MMKSAFRLGFLLLAAGAVASASADMLDRPQGIKIGQRLTLKPYVSFSASYESNPDGRHGDQDNDVMWTVNPNLGITYKAESWALDMNVYYRYHAYTKSEVAGRLNQHSYGQNLRFNWSNSSGGARGWSLLLSETFQKISMADDWVLNDGRTYNNDRWEVTIQGAVQRRFNEHWHSDANVSYYLSNPEDSGQLGAVHGWQRWTVGAEAGFAPSRWTDILLTGTYMGFKQDNVTDGLSHDSQGFSVQAGLGTYATERISYRFLAGWSRFEYANAASTDDGFVYTISGNWKISDTLQTMALATSYYQPSERQQNSRSRVDSVSWGLAKTFVRGALNTTFDGVYRHETHEAADDLRTSLDYELDTISARLGFSYTLNRYFSLFAYGEYMRSWNDQSRSRNGYGDYDRWRATLGFRLTY